MIQSFAKVFIFGYCTMPIDNPENKQLQKDLKCFLLTLFMETIFEEAISTKYYFEIISSLIVTHQILLIYVVEYGIRLQCYTN